MPDKCLKCSVDLESLKDVAKCAECEGLYHPQCTRLKTTEAFKKLKAKEKAAWRCDTCKLETASAHSNPETESLMTVLQSVKKDMADNMKESRKRFDGLEDSMKSVKEVVEELRDKIKSLEEENVKLKQQLEQNEVKMTENNKVVKKVRGEMNELQQYTRRSNIEIKGVPLTSQEDVYVILDSIAQALNIPFHRSDISVAHRLPAPETGHPAIIAAFISRTTRAMWLTAARKVRLTTANISTHLQPGPIFVNCHLMGLNKYLLARAKRMVRDKKLVGAWATDEGKVMVRRTERGKAQHLAVEEDLNKVLAADG